jgi:uncharacterized Zn finger protein (UPF0148 family)
MSGKGEGEEGEGKVFCPQCQTEGKKSKESHSTYRVTFQQLKHRARKY